MLVVAQVINDPHFANSYQIFYRDFRNKCLGADYETELRVRYIFAGVIVPIALVSFFAISMVRGDAHMMGYGANIMLFLVGWHYVKQGYGMLIVDSVLKRQFFADFEKKVFLANAYACWIYYWILANEQIAERELWGLQYFMFDFPEVVSLSALAAASITSALTIIVFLRSWMKNGRSLPLNGTVAYLASLYIWLFLRLDPLILLFIPAFHSLQYLVVVWRYQLNIEHASADNGSEPRHKIQEGREVPKSVLRFTRFVVIGLLLGALGFWGLPIAFENLVPYDHDVFGATAFFFMFWIFINVHHYFLDNVMWRRQNPDIGKHLFAQR